MTTLRQFHQLLLLGAFLLLCACSYKPVKFTADPPVEVLDDRHPGPIPEKTKFEFIYVGVDGLVRQPLVEGMRTRRILPSQDVNSLDNVPASTWYTPRLGYCTISPEELLHGPEQIGPPQRPVTVVNAKVGGGNPGFVIQDARGHRYLIKFDPPEFPGIETTTALIVNRLFWGFGYNVPEDYLFKFRRDELGIDPDGELKSSDVDSVLSMVAPAVDSLFRSTASLYIPGKILGPIPESGIRKGDVNDRILHENRRVLRALRVFCAFTHQSGIRPDNSLDVYEGEAGQGHVKHYLLDFGEALGGHGAGKQRKWDGYEYFISLGELFGSFFRPFRKKPWEELEFTKWKAVGAFEGNIFHPAHWKETWRYKPFDYSQPDDDYWAAKIIAALSRDHLEALVKAAQYPTQAEEQYIIESLIKRRDKIVEYYFNRVTPLEAINLEDNTLVLSEPEFSLNTINPKKYRITIMDENGKTVTGNVNTETVEQRLTVPILEDWWNQRNYLICSITLDKAGVKSRGVQFHLKREESGATRILGIVH